MNKKIKISLLVFSALAVWILTGLISALYLTAPNHQDFKIPAIENISGISILTEDGITISASFIQGRSDYAVIILPGIGSNRLSSISRAQNYTTKGFSILLPDLRGTGKSDGNKITFGWEERKDLLACYQFLKKKGYRKVGVHGCSLGAATITYSLQDVKDYVFIILESCYDNLENAFYNRVKKYPLPEFAYSPIHFFINRIISRDIKELQPEEFIKLAKAPVLIMAGDSEFQVKLSETEKIYNNCSSARKSIHIFKGGKHEDFKNRFNKEYETIFYNFLNDVCP